MTVGPILERELRVQARQKVTYVLRVVAAVVAFLETWVLLPHSALMGNTSRLFSLLHETIFGALWLLVPFLAADCLSRERREGTLGLLFLTPLKAWEIVAAKGLAHGLRGLTLYLAVLPALTVPLLLGGVSWKEVVMSGLILGVSLSWALSAGLLASTMCQERHRAMVLAALLAGIFLWLQGGLYLALVGIWVREISNFWYGFTLLADHGSCWSYFLTAPGLANPEGIFHATITLALIAMPLPVLAVFLAIRGIQNAWQDAPPSQFRAWLLQTFCKPSVAGQFYRRWLRQGMVRNPIGWLERRRWGVRVMGLLWLGLTTVLLVAALNSRLPLGSPALFQLLFLILSLCLVVNATSGFFRERAGGLMELILVSPVTEWHMIFSRTRSLLVRFIPAAGLLYAAWWFTQPAQPWYYHNKPPAVWLGYFAIIIPTLPFVGLYFSVRCRHYMIAVAATIGVGLFVPWITTRIFWTILLLQDSRLRYALAHGQFQESPMAYLVTLNGWPPILFQTAIAAFLSWALYRRLVERRFAV